MLYFFQQVLKPRMGNMIIENKIRRNTSRQLPAFDIQELMQGMCMMQVEKINIRKTIRFIKL